jgi:hypothetical protein
MEKTMKKKLYTLVLAAMLAVSMSAFAGPDTKSCNKADAKYCEIKDACCKDADKCDKAKPEKKCEKKADKKAS